MRRLETVANAAQLPLDDDHDALRQLRAELDRFAAATDGATVSGRIPVPELRCVIEYVLPGRRSLGHYVRVTSADPRRRAQLQQQQRRRR